ncbi:MAG: hypothetical protein HYU47_12150 [Deltaproteobacteria bacterium]|nr:hypothetical protein [Deltaproteobacteria bacterium]
MEEVKACIVLKPQATPETLPPEEIWDFCQTHLAPFKIPRYLEYRKDLPKTLSSKIQKGVLREEARRPGQAVFDRAAVEKSRGER